MKSRRRGWIGRLLLGPVLAAAGLLAAGLSWPGGPGGIVGSGATTATLDAWADAAGFPPPLPPQVVDPFVTRDGRAVELRFRAPRQADPAPGFARRFVEAGWQPAATSVPAPVSPAALPAFATARETWRSPDRQRQATFERWAIAGQRTRIFVVRVEPSPEP